MVIIRQATWILAPLLAAVAGYTDYRWRRIPNWLTVPGVLLGIAVNSAARGRMGMKDSLFGLGLGLLILFPFVLLRSLGAGDWKLIGAVGALVGPRDLLSMLFVTLVIAGIMALILVIWKNRLGQTLRNIGRMLAAMANLRLPGTEVSLDNPESSKIPFGVAVAMAVILCSIGHIWPR